MRLVLTRLDEGFSEHSVVTDHRPVLERTKQFNPEGIFSERIFGRIPSSGKEYSCDCRETEGRFFEGTTCPKCGSKVTCRDTIFAKRGWIELGEHSIVSPLFFHYLQRAIGKKMLTAVLKQQRELTIDGLPRERGCGTNYENLGLLGFKEHFEEVIGHFREKKRSDAKAQEYFALIDAHRDLVFTSRIPVFSHILRPALMQGTQIIFDEVNNVFNQAIAYSQALGDLTGPEKTDTKVNTFLWHIQERAIEVMKHVLASLSGKKGYLRSSLLGVRVNFSARCVIVPLDAGHDMDEVHVPYHAFLELYRFQITNALSRLRRVSLLEADGLWNEAQTRFDPSIYGIMREMIKASGEGMPCLLNRNPTIKT